jgi:hypothetical protein
MTSEKGVNLAFNMMTNSTINVYSTDANEASKIIFEWPSNPLKADKMYNTITNDKVLDCSAGNVKRAFILNN